MVRAGLMLVALATSWTLGCASAPRNLSACSATTSPNAICDLMNPEDLDYMPGRKWIVVSEMAQFEAEAEFGAKPKQAGRLLAFRPATSERLTIFPAKVGWDLSSSEGVEPSRGWGDPRCAGGPAEDWFQPHGIAVGRHASGAAMLAVVNHGGREAIELFEIEPEETPEIAWRGCVPLPKGVMANDLALFRDGGFVVTKFMTPIEEVGPSAMWTLMKISAGWDTGAVYRWTPGEGFRLVPGSEGSAPNGIAIAPDESAIYVAQWGETNVYRVSLDADEPARKEARLEHRPDNLTWTEEGHLLAAGQSGRIGTILGCGEIEEGGCGLDYGVYSIDPETLEVELLFTGKGAASVALEFGRDVFVGSFSGDQIERVTKSH